MKKILFTSLFGIGAIANSFGTGSILFDNYTQGTYNQVVWPPSFGHPAGSAVNDVALQMQFVLRRGHLV